MSTLTTEDRIALLVAQADVLEPWLGAFTAADLRGWLADQLGDARALDEWVRRGGIHSRAVALSPVLHVISGNTPHAGFQSLFRGLLVGGRQRVKLPSAGLPPVEAWIESLPPALGARIETSHTLPDAWRDSPVAVVFGDGETVDFFRGWCPPATRLIAHGPKISAAVLFARPDEATLARLAEDILRHDQRGCLSVQNVLCDADAVDARGLAGDLARALERAREDFPRPAFTLSDSGRISNFRETFRYRAANGEPIVLWESRESMSWTVVLDATPEAPLLTPTPGGGTVIVRPFSGNPTPESLGPESSFLSTVVVHPFRDAAAITRLESIAPPRVCAPGMAQFAGLFWSHDGMRPLAELVRWRDLG